MTTLAVHQILKVMTTSVTTISFRLAGVCRVRVGVEMDSHEEVMQRGLGSLESTTSQVDAPSKWLFRDLSNL